MLVNVQRILQPELLDSLPPSSAEAIRSRRDLRLVNCLMGNERWISRQVLKAVAGIEELRLLEIGAGDGHLINALAEKVPRVHRAKCSFHACDLIPKPSSVSSIVEWHQQDVLDRQPSAHENAPNVIIANLFLHHFETPQLNDLFASFDPAPIWIINEPYRSRSALALGRFISPFVNEVTRHDMMISIKAGFRDGELPQLIQRANRQIQWSFKETRDARGALRLIANPNLADR